MVGVNGTAHLMAKKRLEGTNAATSNLGGKPALREFVGLWSGWLVVGFMLGGVLGRRSLNRTDAPIFVKLMLLCFANRFSGVGVV